MLKPRGGQKRALSPEVDRKGREKVFSHLVPYPCEHFIDGHQSNIHMLRVSVLRAFLSFDCLRWREGTLPIAFPECWACFTKI
eukprot:1161835-Pelagomonas_calceolata.AAC.6